MLHSIRLEFVDTFNSVNSAIDQLTNKGLDGTEKGILARDVVVSGIKEDQKSGHHLFQV